MAITIAQVEAILKIQTAGFDAVTQSIKGLSDNFDKATNAMLAAINKVEGNYNKIGAAAKKASKDSAKAADDTTQALLRQNKVMFDAGEQFANFASKASTSLKNPTETLKTLEGAFKNVSEAMNTGIMEDKQFTLSKQGWTAALNEANRKLIEQISLEKELANAQKDEAKAIAVISREEQAYINMIDQARAKQAGQNFSTNLNNSFGIGGTKNSAKDSMNSVFAPLQNQQQMINTESFKQNFTQAIQSYTNLGASVNSAKQSMAAFLSVEMSADKAAKLVAQETLAANSAMDRQFNTLLRAKNQLDALSHAITQVVANEEQQAAFTNQATEAYERLNAALAKPLKSSDVTKQMLMFTGAMNEIKRNSGVTDRLQQGLSDVGKMATLAVGPLSGVAARLTAFAYLADQMGPKFAGMAAGGTALAVAWGASVKTAADFQLGLAKVAAAAEMGKTDTDKLGASMIALSKDLMVPNEELLKIAQSAAQAGVTGTANLTNFTKVVAQLTRTTSLTADTAADDLLALANVTKFPIEKMSELGDMVTKVGQSSLGSESKVLGLATELAKAGFQYGFTTKEAIAWAGALADTGQEAESSSTALVSAMNKIANVITGGGEKMHEFANFIGMTDDQLTKTFKENGPAVLKAFLEQVSKAPDALSKLTDFNDIDIKNVRMTRSLSALSTYFQDIAKHEGEVDTATGALQDKFDALSKTLLRQFEGVKANFQAIGVALGDSILNPLTNVLVAFKALTSFTNTWTLAIEALTAVALNFGVLWAGGKIMGTMTTAFALGKKAIDALKLSVAGATVELPLFAAAEGSVTASTRATTVALGVLELGFRGLMALLRTFWPILAFEGITWVIGKFYELANAEKEAARQSKEAVASYQEEIEKLVKLGNVKDLLAKQDQNKKDLDAAQAKLTTAQATDKSLAHMNPNSTLMIPGTTLETGLKDAQRKVDELTAEKNIITGALQDLVENAAGNTFAVVNKASTRAITGIQGLIDTVKNKVSEVDTLKNKGVDAFDAQKIADNMSKSIDKALAGAAKEPGGAKAYWVAQLDSINKAVDGFSPEIKEKLAPAAAAFQKAVSDTLAGKADAHPEIALKGLTSSIIGIGANAEVAAAKLKTSMNSIARDADRAENAVVKTFRESSAQLDAVNKVLDAQDAGSFKNLQNSLSSAREVARIKGDLEKMSQDKTGATKKNPLGFGQQDLKFLSDQLGIASTDLDGLATALYNTDTAAKAGADAIREINQAMQEHLNVQEDLKKSNDKLAFDKSILGLSDHDKQIAGASYNQKERMTVSNDRVDSTIKTLQDAMESNLQSDNPSAKLDDIYRKGIEQLKATKFSIDDVSRAAKEAGLSMADFLDKSIETERLTAQMDTLRDSFQQFGQDVIINFDNIGSAFSTLLKNMAASMLQNRVMGPLSDFLFGMKGGTDSGWLGGAVKSLMGYAAGGDVTGNKPIIVGEKGPEIFVPGMNGSIVNNNDAFGGAGMGTSPSMGGSNDSTIHIVIEASSEFDAKIVGVSNSVANSVVMSYDRKKLPTRVSQIVSDPRAK